MYIPPKRQQEQIDKVKNLTKSFKRHWDKLYANPFPAYRRLANGELPSKIEDRLGGYDYKYYAKLIPRIIPVAIEYLKTSITNSIFNRERIFEFVGRVNEADHNRADSGYKLVSYAMDVTDAEDVCEQIVEDALEVGGGFGEIVHHTERVLSPRYNDVGADQLFQADNKETIFVGPMLKYLRPEMVYTDNRRHIKKITAYAKIMSVPISTPRKEAVLGGLYAEYAQNVKKIERHDYNPNPIEEYDIHADHKDELDATQTPDFPVQINEFWVRMSYEKNEIPTWYVITIANWDSANAQLIRFERDPMSTGHHPLIMCRVYPKNNRLYGESVPEKLQNYMLEKFHKRNQRINLVNLAHELAGMLITQQGVINRDSIYVKRKKILKISGNPREVQNIPIDLTPLGTSINEEAIIDKEVQEEVGMNPIALGTAPMRRETATAIMSVDENARARANRPIRAVERTLIKPLAKGFLLHCQLFMPDEFKLRILGRDNQYEFQSMSKRDILGVFDVKCRASSEMLTKGLKQALMNNLAQIYLPNSSVRMDRQEFAREHFRVSEFPNVDRVVDAISNEQLDADRENGILLSGLPYKVLEHDDHERHLQVHVEALNEAQGEADTSALELHIQHHQQMIQTLQGQVNVGKEQPGSSNRGELLDNINSTINTGLQ